MKKTFSILVVGLLMFFNSCEVQDSESISDENVYNASVNSESAHPGIINLEITDLFPEGIEYDNRYDRFLLGSAKFGVLGQVIDGEYSEWIADEDLISPLGIQIDQGSKRVLVVNADAGVSVKSSPETAGLTAGLAAYNLSGERIFYTDLAALRSGGHFANDVAVDNKGNAYVTDSFQGIIYKVEPDGEAGIFYEDSAFDPMPGGIGFNGIDFDPRGFLLVSHMETNRILAFPLDSPEEYWEVELSESLYTPDGLYLRSPNELLVVNNDFGGPNAGVQTFVTRDKWNSAQLVSEFSAPNVFPATVTVRRNIPYVIYSYVHIALSGGSQEDFQIVPVE